MVEWGPYDMLFMSFVEMYVRYAPGASAVVSCRYSLAEYRRARLRRRSRNARQESGAGVRHMYSIAKISSVTKRDMASRSQSNV